MMKNKIHILLFSLLAASVSMSTANALEMSELMQGLSANKYKKSYFTETKYAFYLEEPLQSEGTIEYSPPDILIKKTTKPIRVIQEISSSSIRTVDKDGEVAVLDLDGHPAVAILFETIRGVLSGNQKIIEKHFKVKFSNSRSNWSLTLVPKKENLRSWFKKIYISGEMFQVRKIKIVEANDDTTIMNIHEPG